MTKSITLQRMTQGELPQRPSFREEALFLDSDARLKTLSGTTGQVEDVETSVDLTALEVEVAGKQSLSEKDQPNGYPSLDADGNLVGRMILADATGVSLQNGELGLNAAGQLIIGTAAGKRLVFDKTKAMIDAFGTLNADAAAIPAGAAKMLTVRETTVSGITVKTTTGYARGMNWDGTLTDNAGTGDDEANIVPTWLTAASPYTARIPKLIAVWSTDSSGDPDGALTYLDGASNQLTALDVSEAVQLASLSSLSNQLTSLDVSRNILLTYLDCSENQLTSIDVSLNTDLVEFNCYSNQLVELDVSLNVALTTLRCYSNQLAGLDISSNVALTNFQCFSNPLSSLLLCAPESAGDFNISTGLEMPITSSKAAIETWFSTLPEIGPEAALYVGDAVLGLDPAPDTTIATNKGWLVFGDA